MSKLCLRSLNAKLQKELAAAIKELIASHHRPVVLAVDGGSGAGKSSLAKWIGTKWNAALISLDDFYAADIPDSRWDQPPGL